MNKMQDLLFPQMYFLLERKGRNSICSIYMATS